MEPQTSELKIADSSKDPPRQENVAEHSFTSSTVNFDASQQVENVVDDAASASEEGTSLSKRALKRLRRCQLKKEKQEKKCKIDCTTDQKKQSDIITKESLSASDYYFQDGLRKVYPYYFTFKTYAKKRWYGQSLVSIYVEEFQNFSPERIKKSVESQDITVNGKPIQLDYVLRNGDLIENRIHSFSVLSQEIGCEERFLNDLFYVGHELPITAKPIEILANTSELLVVNKPSSIPIHPCGRYNFNSLTYILAKENGFRNLRAIYRLDRLTSGVVVFCKTEAKTKEMMESVKQHLLQKEYVCRVDGEFPSGEVECNVPVDVLSIKLGIHTARAGGKQSRTVFERMSFNGKTSVVKCKPVTGRTHQIRVHLQYLGFPISNDPIYSSSVWGPSRGKDGDFGKSEEQLLTDLEQLHHSSRYLDESAADTAKSSALEQSQPFVDMSVVDSNSRQAYEVDAVTAQSKQDGHTSKPLELTTRLPTIDLSRMTYDPDCIECRWPFKNPTPDYLVMYLHAYSYQGPDWCFKTPLPQWADEDWSG